MKYSYHCNKCGHTVLSNDKEEIKLAKVLHKQRRMSNGIVVPKCLFVPTGRGSIARPDLDRKIKGIDEPVYDESNIMSRISELEGLSNLEKASDAATGVSENNSQEL